MLITQDIGEKRELIGRRYGKFIVVSIVAKEKYTILHCRCDCGNEKNVYEHNLKSGRIRSCGCERRKVAKKTLDENIHIYKGIQIEKSAAKTIQKNNTSGFRGVTLDKRSGKWRVRMILQGVRYELGYYSDFEEAVKARVLAEEKRDDIVEEYKMLNHNKVLI